MSPAKRRERSPEERAAAAEASRIRVEEAAGRIDEGVHALRDGDAWRKFLSQSAKFHRYSFGNLLLIGAQNPQATRVASYRKWLSLDRQVRRGEHGLRVLAPVKVMVPVVDEHDVQRRDANGKPIRRPQVRGWTTETVFDVSQTDGEPLARPPEPIELDGPAPDGMWEALAESTTSTGYQLELAELPTGVMGRTVYASRTMTIDPGQHGGTAGQAATLAHELAHIMLHEPGTAAVDADLTTAHCRGQRELEAESTAIVVAEAWGLDTSQMSLPYIAGWLSAVPDADAAVRRVGDRVVRAAHAIEVASRDNDHGPLMERIAAARTAAAELRQQVEHRATPAGSECQHQYRGQSRAAATAGGCTATFDLVATTKRAPLSGGKVGAMDTQMSESELRVKKAWERLFTLVANGEPVPIGSKPSTDATPEELRASLMVAGDGAGRAL